MNGIGISGAAVVDDDYDDSKALIQVLSSKGVSVVYYSGEPKDFPPSPTGGIRVLFLDLWLDGATEAKTRMSKLVHVLKELIGKENGPYLIIAWTSHEEDLDDLKIAFGVNDLDFMRPIECVTIDKQKVKIGSEYDSGKILNLIEGTIKGHPALEFLMSWELFSIDSVIRTTNLLTREKGDSDEDVRCLIQGLAHSEVGDRASADPPLAIMSSVFVLNKILLDELDSNASSGTFHLSTITDPCDGTNGMNDKARETFNRKLNIRITPSKSSPHGTVFAIDGETVKQAQWDSPDMHLEKGHSCTNTKVLVEVSPLCDYSNGKMEVLRFLPGYLFESDEGLGKPKFKNNGQTGYIYRSNPFRLDGSKSFWLSLNMLYFFTSDRSILDKLVKRIFTIRETMLIDIQHKLANHISRVGVDSFDQVSP